MVKTKRKTTIEDIADRIARFNGSKPKVTVAPKPAKVVTVKKDPNSPFIAVFPIAGHLPGLIAALPGAGIATRDDLLELVALETGSTRIAAQKIDEFLGGAAFVSFKNSKGATSSVARIAAQATGIPFQTVYGSYVSNPVARQALSDPEPETLSSFPLAVDSPYLTKKLIEKGTRTPAMLVAALKENGFVADAAMRAADQILKGQIYDDRNRPTALGKVAFRIAGSDIPSKPAVIIPTQKQAKTVRGRQPKALTAYPLNNSQPELVKKLIGSGIVTRADMITSLTGRGLKERAATIAADKVLRNKLYDSRSNRLIPVAKILFEIAEIEAPGSLAIGMPARKQAKGVLGRRQSKALTTYPLNDSHPDIVVALVEKGIATRADFVDALKKRGFKASGANIGADKVLRGKLLGRKNRLSPVAKAAYEIAGLELPAVLNIVPAQKQPKTIRGRQPKALTAYPLNDSRPDIVAALADKGVTTRADLVKAVQAKDYKASGAKIGIGIVLRGRLHSRPNQLSPIAKAIYAIADLEVPIAPSAPPQGRRKPHWISPAKRKALADYPLEKTSPELIAKLREKGIETRADFIDTLKKRGFKAGAAYIGAGKVLGGKLFGIKNRLSPVAKAAYEIAGLEIPAPLETVASARKQIKSTWSRSLTAYPLNETHPRLVAGLVANGVATRVALIGTVKLAGFAEGSAVNGVNMVLKGCLTGLRKRLTPISKAVYKIAGVELPAEPQPVAKIKKGSKPVSPARLVRKTIAAPSENTTTPLALPAAPKQRPTPRSTGNGHDHKNGNGAVKQTVSRSTAAQRAAIYGRPIDTPVLTGLRTARASEPYKPFAMRRQEARPEGSETDHEKMDIFDFLQTEPHWKKTLASGIGLSVLLQDMHRRDQFAAEAFKNSCKLIPRFLESFPDNPRASELKDLEQSLAREPVTLGQVTRLKQEMHFMREYALKNDSFMARLREDAANIFGGGPAMTKEARPSL